MKWQVAKVKRKRKVKRKEVEAKEVVTPSVEKTKGEVLSAVQFACHLRFAR